MSPVCCTGNTAIPYAAFTPVFWIQDFVAVTTFTFSVFTEIRIELGWDKMLEPEKRGQRRRFVFSPKFSKTNGPDPKDSFFHSKNVFRVKNSGIWY